MMKTNTRRRAFSLTEILMVTGCILLISVPLLQVFQSGVKSGMTGILQVETTLAARKICRRVEQDVQNACILLDDGTEPSPENIDPEILIRKTALDNGMLFSLYCFPTHGSIEDFVPLPSTLDLTAKSTLQRRLSKVEYRWENGELKRSEFFHADHPLHAQYPEGLIATLSSKVNFFDIQLKTIEGSGDSSRHLSGKQFLHHLNLQLLESPGKSTTNNAAPSREAKEWQERRGGVIIADFFSTVYSEHLNQLLNRYWENRNWYHSLSHP